MKTYNKLSKYFLLLGIIFMVSCTDESKFTNPVTYHLDKGAFAQFEEEAPAVVAFDIPEEAGFTRTVSDVNGNMASYKLDIIATLVDGRTVTGSDFYTTSTFPSTINVTAKDVATNLGLELSDLNFGDNIRFIATATRNDGTEFNGFAPGTDTSGNTEPNLTQSQYRNAMNFAFTFACPTFPNTDLVGTWTVETLGFASYFGETQTTREIVAGPNANQITIVGGEYPTAGGEQDDLIVTFNEAGIATAVNTDGVSFGPGNSRGLPTNTYLLVKGLLLPCADKIDLTMNFSPFSGNPHPFVLVR